MRLPFGPAWRAIAGMQIPWDGFSNADIEQHVRNGERVPALVSALPGVEADAKRVEGIY